jgi:hypothetical protein
MAAAASFVSTRSDNSVTQRYFYQYLNDATLYELLMRVKKHRLDYDVHQAIRNSSDVDLHVMKTVSRVVYSNTKYGPDIYIYIEIQNPQKALGHITFHLIPTNTGRNTIAPLHIRNQIFPQKVSRIRINTNITKERRLAAIRLEKGTAPSAFININSNSELSKISEIVFKVLNNYLSKTSDQSLSLHPEFINIIDNQVLQWVSIITVEPETNRSRIQRTRFSFQRERRGGFCKTRRKKRKA